MTSKQAAAARTARVVIDLTPEDRQAWKREVRERAQVIARVHGAAAARCHEDTLTLLLVERWERLAGGAAW